MSNGYDLYILGRVFAYSQISLDPFHLSIVDNLHLRILINYLLKSYKESSLLESWFGVIHDLYINDSI